MFYTIPVSKEPQVATTPIGAKSVRYIFFENKNDGIFTFKEQQDDVISISIGGRQICRNLIVLPFCTNTPYGTNKMPWQKVALEANINVDFSEIKISAAGGENDYNVVFVCSDEPVDESRGFDFFETKKIPLIRPMLNSEARALVDEAWEKAKAAKLDELKQKGREDWDKWFAWYQYDIKSASYEEAWNQYYYQKAFYAAFQDFNKKWNDGNYEGFDFRSENCGFRAQYRCVDDEHYYRFGCTDDNGDFIADYFVDSPLTPGESFDQSDIYPDCVGPMGDGIYRIKVGDYSCNTEPTEPELTKPTEPECERVTEVPQHVTEIPADTEMTLTFDNIGLVYPEEGKTLLYGEYNSRYRISISIWLQNKCKNPSENFWGKENELLFDKEPQFMFAYCIVKPKGADIIMSSDIKLNMTLAGASHEIIPPGTDLDIISANSHVPFRDALLTFDPSDGVKRSLSVTVRENAKTAQRGHITKLPAIEYWTLYLLFGYKKII